MALTDSFVEKVILDRNGNTKTIKVKVAGDGVIARNPTWRGLEFGWTADDIAPENTGTGIRQELQEWAVAHHCEVVARHVKIGRTYIPLIYTKGGALVFVMLGRKMVPQGWKEWADSAKQSIGNVLVHSYTGNAKSSRHRFARMS